MVTTAIYKICERSLWDAAVRAGVFAGAPVDLRDGFIHFSTAGQVAETAAKHFAGVTDLVLVAVDAERLGPDIEMGSLARRRAVSPSLRPTAARRRCSGPSRCRSAPTGAMCSRNWLP